MQLIIEPPNKETPLQRAVTFRCEFPAQAEALEKQLADVVETANLDARRESLTIEQEIAQIRMRW